MPTIMHESVEIEHPVRQENTTQQYISLTSRISFNESREKGKEIGEIFPARKRYVSFIRNDVNLGFFFRETFQSRYSRIVLM